MDGLIWSRLFTERLLAVLAQSHPLKKQAGGVRWRTVHGANSKKQTCSAPGSKLQPSGGKVVDFVHRLNLCHHLFVERTRSVGLYSMLGSWFPVLGGMFLL